MFAEECNAFACDAVLDDARMVMLFSGKRQRLQAA
jgi:hypothetical protein